MKTEEQKVAEAIANATENHWFNPATIGRKLADQPFYTIDRIMEMITQIIRYQALRHNDELTTDSGIYNSGMTSEGLFLANELDKLIRQLAKQYKWENLSLPLEPGKLFKMAEPKIHQYNKHLVSDRYSN